MSTKKMQTNSKKYIVSDEFSLDKYTFPLIPGDKIFFYGDLGAGKSTFIRHLLRKHFNNPELIVRSPTYTYYQKYEAEVGLNPPVKGGIRGVFASETNPSVSFHSTSPLNRRVSIPKTIYHFDLYRIEDVETFYSIGAMEILENPYTIALIEWPELIEEFIEPTKKISIRILENGEREISIE